MQAHFSASDITYIANGRIAAGRFGDSKGTICSDIRQLSHGQWFIALTSDDVDGHEYISEATDAGAMGCIVNRRRRYPLAGPSANLVSVPDTREAYFSIARAWRSWATPLVIAVTAGNRQSAITTACSIIFSGLRCQTTDFNVGEELAIPATILKMRKSCQLLMLNMKPRQPGWLSLMGDTAKPRIAVIADGAGQDRRLARWQCGLLESLDECDGLAIVATSDQEILARARQVYGGKIHSFSPDFVEKVERRNGRCLVQFKDSKLIFSLPSSEILVEDVWSSVMCGREYGFSDRFMAQSFLRVTSMAQGNEVIIENQACL
ncbi:MAG TPA: hypothetical protein V6C69_07225 [Trichormus sp.]|jgi:UDP-N-acetylmuramoyl-tripeptide--D-alanyl-D-alanine ligase